MKRIYRRTGLMNGKMRPAALLILWVLGGVVAAQDTTMVTGVIRSSSNQPLSGVSVSIEGSDLLPVVTGEQGEFSLPSVTGDEWLIVSPASGYKMRRVYLNGRKELTLYLSPEDISSGDDPVALLSRQVPRRDIVSSYSELGTANLHHTAEFSVDQHLLGRIPGMYVVNRSGMPGSGAVTTFRGISSISSSNLPVYIVDGIPLVSHGLFGSNLEGYEYNGLMAVNPFDISRTTVLKDAAVSAVFGSRGSNGIILIETLDPSATQTSIDINMRTGYSLAPPNQIPQMNGVQHKTLMSEVLFSSGMNEELIRDRFPNLYLTEEDDRFIDYQHNTNWQDLIFSNSTMYNLNVKVKGGDEIARYGLSFGYLDSDGIMRNTGFSGYNLRFVSRLNIFTWLKMDAGVSLNYNTSDLKEAATVKETSPIITALAKSPMLHPYRYDLEGREMALLAEADEIGVSNPVATIENYEAYNNNYNFTSFMGLEGTISRSLSAVSKFSFTYDVLKEQIFQPNRGMEPYYNNEAINVSKASNNDLTSIFNNTYLRFHRQFGGNHQVYSNTGFYLMSNRFEYDWGLTKNAQANDQYRSLQDGQNNLREIGGDNRVWNWISLYEHVTYSFRDRYMAVASVALDGSSRVGYNADNTLRVGGLPFGLFYSGGLAWRVSGEPFLRDLAWLEDMKLRFSAGRTGNDDIGEASATRYYDAVKFRETVGLYPAVLTNDRLTYETVTTLNAGVDLSILGNRFHATLDYYISTTGDMIIFTPVESFLGYEYLMENGGTMENRGLEAGLFLRIVDGARFKWDLSGTVTSAENRITQIEGDRLIYDVPGARRVNQVGSPANSFYGYVYQGVFSTEEEADAAGLLNNKGVRFDAGDAIYVDLSGPDGVPDGIINEFDRTEIGNPLPELFGGVSSSISWKGFTLSAAVNFVYGNELFNYVRYRNERMTGLENQSMHVLNRWQYEGQVTDVPRALAADPLGNSAFSTRWIEDGSFARLRYLKLSYTIPSEFLMFKNAEFYASANNLVTLTRYLGYDPEFAYSFSQLYQGIDYGLTPTARQFIVGINIGL